MFLDDYQRTGSGPIDVRALGVDFMVTGCLKYLLAAAGVAFLYVRRDLIERLEPTITGWFGRVNPFAFRIDEIDWPPTANRFESGTPPVPSAYLAIAGLDLLDRIGYDVVGQQVERLVADITRLLRRAGSSCGHLANQPGAGLSSSSRAWTRRLWCPAWPQDGIVASCRGNGLRVSFHAYNNEDDVDAVVAGLEAEAALLERQI